MACRHAQDVVDQARCTDGLPGGSVAKERERENCCCAAVRRRREKRREGEKGKRRKERKKEKLWRLKPFIMLVFSSTFRYLFLQIVYRFCLFAEEL